MAARSGSLSINSENIFPIIKKWLYSDCDIFLRELVSNGCDAISKLRKLSAIGEASVEADTAFSIDILLDKDAKTLTITDNGIGMSKEIAHGSLRLSLSHETTKEDIDYTVDRLKEIVAKLRKRKNRDEKPFALMCADLEAALEELSAQPYLSSLGSVIRGEEEE